MTPTRRKIVYAVSFETLGTLVASVALMLMSDASAGSSLVLSILTATIALSWSFVFNTVFEAWEARQPVKGRSLKRRTAHALMFEGGLVLICIPVMAWWLQVGYLEALVYEAGLIALFIAYTYAFTWGFDRVFGLPASAR
ncbi:PACE efflux transporter [Tabrizicola sp.]|uniref:PACE efflux transporter n=1 Tax=Tabrizicola sp. TaxID=2005166 RepID=UPI001A4E61DB|nr:PACE efflux transporter [Tabrizicola sp.]MBL9075455.1 PACE efflux transporter [Tabrizicola sp.]